MSSIRSLEKSNCVIKEFWLHIVILCQSRYHEHSENGCHERSIYRVCCRVLLLIAMAEETLWHIVVIARRPLRADVSKVRCLFTMRIKSNRCTLGKYTCVTWHLLHDCIQSFMRRCYHITVSKSSEIFTGPTYKLLSSLTAISDVYRSSIRNITTFTKYCLTQWISKFPRSFEIQWVRQYLVNFTGLVGIVNVTVYKTGPIFTGLGHGKLSWLLTLHIRFYQ